jgi:hypothetical protein
LAVQDGFDMGDAAAGRLGRDLAHQGRGGRRRRGASQDQEPEPSGPMRMRPADKRLAQAIRTFEHDDENGDQGAGKGADNQRQNGKDGEAPAFPFRLVPPLGSGIIHVCAFALSERKIQFDRKPPDPSDIATRLD